MKNPVQDRLRGNGHPELVSGSLLVVTDESNEMLKYIQHDRIDSRYNPRYLPR